MKQIVRAIDKEYAAVKYHQDFFLKLSSAKVEAGVFIRPRITIDCKELAKKLNRTEKAAWDRFVAVFFGFLVNDKAENYVELIEGLVTNYRNIGCRISPRVNNLDPRLDKFKNMRGVLEEVGQTFPSKNTGL